MPKAVWKNTVLAESDEGIVLEGNFYFPPRALHKKYFQESETRTTCPWRGTAHYYHIVVDGEVNKDAAWYYPEPSEEAQHLKNHVAFWRGVKVI